MTSLGSENTLGLPCHAGRVVRALTEEDVVALVQDVGNGRGRLTSALTILGGGSNVVLRRRLPGVVCLMRTRGFRQEPCKGGALVSAAAGERWHDLVRYALGQGLAGLENLALIPGSVGAAPIQNIGAYGVELSERFVSLRALDIRLGRIVRFTARECDFAYRDSFFKRPDGEGFIILDVSIRLLRRAAPMISYPDVQLELARLGRQRPSPAQVAEAVIRVRRRKLPDPRFTGNAGSFFKNPEVTLEAAAAARATLPRLVEHPAPRGRIKLSAAQLIDACGWKGRSMGRAGVWRRQPLVLVNLGGAAAADILALGEEIRRDVATRFGITLELEPRVLGED